MLPERTHEIVDVVFRRSLLLRFVGFGDGRREGRIVLAVAGQRLDYVLHLHFEHDVHAALEVEAEVELLLLADFVGELRETEVVHGQVLHGVEIVLLGFGLLLGTELCGIPRRGLLYAPRLEREGELINTRDGQKHSE